MTVYSAAGHRYLNAWQGGTGRRPVNSHYVGRAGGRRQAVEAMTDMIANARRFEMQMKVITSVDENEGELTLLSMS